MTTTKVASCSHSSTRLLGLVGLTLLLVSGCQSTGGPKFTHTNMPASLIAEKRTNTQTLNLTGLASTKPATDIIDREDVIEVAISAGLDEKDTVRLPLRINDQGMANIPEIGPMRLAGMEMEAAEAAIFAACVEKQLYRNPNVTVTMKRQRMNRITVVGAVKDPGVYELPRGRSDLLAAIIAAGELDKDAGTNVEIRNPPKGAGSRSQSIARDGSRDKRGIQQTGHASEIDVDPVASNFVGEPIRVDLVSAAKSGSAAYALEDGAVVHVEKRDPEPYHVIGLVRKPDRYEFPLAEDIRITEAIANAGGVSPVVADKIYVIRRVPNSDKTSVIQVSLKQAKNDSRANLRLAPGDVVSVEQTPATMAMEALNIIRFGISGSLPLPLLF